MRKAKVENGVVVNVALFNPDNMPEWAAEWVDAPGDVSAGDLFDGKAFTKPVVVVTSADVDAERDRRASGGFSFPRPDGDVWQFQSDDVSVKRITGSATLAGFALVNGTQPGDLLWFDPVTPFAWILEDNRVVPVDAPTMLEIGKAAASWEGRHVFAAKALKNMDPIPADYTDDKYWPK